MKKLLYLLAFAAFAVAAFVVFDWNYTSRIQRSAESSASASSCMLLHDPVRHHAFKPNCSIAYRYAGKSYDFITNSLGLRDEKVREVPLADAKPRILVLGDAFTESETAWADSYVGMTAAHFLQYDFLNGGVASYSPSNYLNVTRMLLGKGVDIDEVFVFVDISDVMDEAAFYHDVDASGAVSGPDPYRFHFSRYERARSLVGKHLYLTNRFLEFIEHYLVGSGHYQFDLSRGPIFDSEMSAWTYRKVNETDGFAIGYAPLGVEGGIAREKAKMTLLWQDLESRNIPLSVVVYPWPSQVVHDTADSRQVQIWRDWCEGKCKRFVSAFPPFLAAREQCPPTTPGCWYLNNFIFGDVPYNANGNRLVADVLITSLSAQPPQKRQLPISGKNPGGEATAHGSSPATGAR